MTHSPGAFSTRVVEASAASTLLLWRVLGEPLRNLERDWLLWLSLYWLFTIFAGRSKAWPLVTGGLMILLGLVYLQGQLPHTLAMLGIGP